MVPAKTMFLDIGQRRYQVASFEQASVMFCCARDKMGEGASKTPSPHITGEDGSVIGYIAYNGRVFAGKARAWTVETPLLFDNRVEA
jgi:hypothetical protein